MSEVESIFNEFLLSIVNEKNATLVQEIRHRWKEYLAKPVFNAEKINKRLDELKDKDYEILEKDYIGENSLKSILKVRRKSDNEVFSVNQDTANGNIRRIYIEQGKLIIEMFPPVGENTLGRYFNINEIEKVKQPTVLFTERPPLGLKPRYIHVEQRITEIREAIQRYIDANKAVPISWIAEEYELREWLENNKIG